MWIKLFFGAVTERSLPGPLLLAPRRTGKTSIVKTMAREAGPHGFAAVFVGVSGKNCPRAITDKSRRGRTQAVIESPKEREPIA